MTKGPERGDLITLLSKLDKASRQHKAPIWARVKELLSKPSRKRSEVTLSKISKHSKAGDTVLVPGKILSNGALSHKVTIACFEASKPALAKATAAGCSVIPIAKLLETNASGKSVKIIA